jgi:hypothetical protein
VVARARREAGRDEQWGRPVQDLTGLPRPVRQARALELVVAHGNAFTRRERVDRVG